MTTANNIKGQNLDINEELITALYCRLSPNVAKSKIDKETKGCLLVYQKAEMIPSNLMQLVLP